MSPRSFPNNARRAAPKRRKAGPLMWLARIAALNAQLAPYETQNFRLVHVGEETWSCNWKALVENFMEGYHLSVVHPQTLHGYTPTGLAKKTASKSGWSS